jgi:hypothetical protein
MMKLETITNDKAQTAAFRYSGFVIDSGLVIRTSPFLL